MDAQQGGGRRQRRSPRDLHPKLEAMESRELLTAAPLLVSGQRVTPPNLLAAAALAQSRGVSTAAAQGLNPANAITPLIGSGPTRRELARQRFHAYFSGPVTVSGGRFSDQGKTIYFRGLGGSNQFLHGDFQMAIVFPKDPTAPLFGEAYLQDKNTNSGGQVGLVLQGVSPQTFDKAGRPTQLTFTSDPNIYSGIYFADTSRGTVKIEYSKGSATVVFDGLVYTSGLFSPIRNSDLYSRGGRITPIGGRAG
jgi:hypothetical protein